MSKDDMSGASPFISLALMRDDSHDPLPTSIRSAKGMAGKTRLSEGAVQAHNTSNHATLDCWASN